MTVLIFPAIIRAEKIENGQQNAPMQMANSLENVLASNRLELSNLKDQLRELKIFQEMFRTEIETYATQNALQNQFLLEARLQAEDLKNAIKNNRLASRSLVDRIEKFQKRWGSTSILIQQDADRIELAQEQMADIRQSQLSDGEKKKLEGVTQKVIDVLKEKRETGELFLKTYGDLMARMTTLIEDKKAIGEKLTAELEHLERSSFFRRIDPYNSMMGKDLARDLQKFCNRIKLLFTSTTWKDLWEQINMGGFNLWVIFFTALAGTIAIQARCRMCLLRAEERWNVSDWHYHRIGALLIRCSFPYLGMAALLGIYSSYQFSLLNIEVSRVLFSMLLLLVIVRWGLGYLKHGLPHPPTNLQNFVSLQMKHFFRMFRVAISAFILLNWIAGADSILTWMARSALSAVFLVWAMVFWRGMTAVTVDGAREGQAAPNQRSVSLLKGWSYLVFGGTLMLNLAGFDLLAAQWSISWIETAVLLFWGYVSLNIIREWHRDLQAKDLAADGDRLLTSARLWYWSMIRLARVFWLLAITAGILQTWDPTKVLGSYLGYIFGLTLTIGSLNLSIKGIVLAMAIIFINHLALRIGRALLNEKILDKRSLERGLKDSILSITSYLGWGVTLILALGILGVNTTSLAVVFGALSVGIGFGLQNIFNNFISGLILLFERPIQVGDYVEINGLWAEVKQINVRATVVQTFDNAAVIIPNSEFISQQVTNWSFKDKRMRRNIEVGVAYGSDLDLVENTIMEIVMKTPKALKYPRPDVIFIDHAASALIFRLRVWVHVDDYWTVANQIRREIDRRFRELNIEIAFPQQDVHIRTLPGDVSPADATDDPVGASPRDEFLPRGAS